MPNSLTLPYTWKLRPDTKSRSLLRPKTIHAKPSKAAGLLRSYYSGDLAAQEKLNNLHHPESNDCTQRIDESPPVLVEGLVELGDESRLVVLLEAELLLAELEVLHEHVALVLLLDLLLHLLADVALQLDQLQLLLQQQQRLVHPRGHAQGLQDALEGLRVGAGQKGPDVGQGAGVVQVDGAKLDEELEVLVVQR
eukprot:scaffold302843_cov40-Prasinocladus_malaysianus.AAC.2